MREKNPFVDAIKNFINVKIDVIECDREWKVDKEISKIQSHELRSILRFIEGMQEYF